MSEVEDRTVVTNEVYASYEKTDSWQVSLGGDRECVGQKMQPVPAETLRPSGKKAAKRHRP